jgi:hypothetical protein
MKSLSESRVSLDIPPTMLRCFMSRVKQQLSALSVLFSLEFLSLGFFANGTFSWSTQHVPPLLKAASHAHARAVKLDSPAKPDGRFVFESSGEPTSPSGVFLTAKENVGISLRSFVVSPLFFRIILAPKVSRYISKSVLNL